MSVSNSKIATPTARAKLPISGKPLYIKLAKGINLGYRRNAGDGVWVVRSSDGHGHNTVSKIGMADREGLLADNKTVFTFPQAQAIALAAKDGKVAARRSITIADALEAYETDRVKNGLSTSVMRRVRAILEPLLATPLTSLTVGKIKLWHDAIPGRADTINRLCATIAAALRWAALRHDIPNSLAWSMAKGGGMERKHDSQRRDRNVFLKDEEVHAIVAASYQTSHEFGLLVELLAVTGVRYGQLRDCRVDDLQGLALVVRQSNKGGRGKKRPPQRLELSPRLADALRVHSAGRPSTDSLVLKPSGAVWKKSDQLYRFRQIVKAAQLDPKLVSIYALRHTHIMDQLRAGVPILTVAQLHETSAEEIQSHYAIHLSSQTVLPPPKDYGPRSSAEVRQLRV